MPPTTSTFVSPPRQSQPARPRTPPDDSTPSSPTNTIPSSSSHSHQTQVSSSLATDTAASSPDINSTSLPYITSALEPPKGFVPAPSFSIARAPRYPGWRPELEMGLGAAPPSPNKRTSVYMKPGGGIGSQTPPTTSPPYSPSAQDSIPPLPSLTTIIPPTPSPKFIPKKPLSPKHLIRIANALGVQIPTPIGGGVGERSASLPRSVPNGVSPSSPAIRRPSSANSNRGMNQRGVVNTATRFLLYIVPPSHLTADLVGNAGLANQFRRGSLLPLHATLPSQLAAIAREYSLPSTQGLVVYLLDIKHDVLGDEAQPIGEEWLGPRIGDESWRLLWSGMVRAERETFERTMALQRQALSPAPSPSPRLPPSTSAPLNLANGNSSPAESVDSLPGSSGEASPQQATNPPRSASLRPLLTEQLQQEAAQRASSPFFSHTRSETMRSDSPSLSSIKTTTSAVSPLLPSLPIVGKIEFDIDRSKATWYDNWSKRSRTRTASTVGQGSGGSESGNRSPLIPLQLGTIPPIVGSTTGKSPGRKLPPSPLQPVSPHLDVEAAQPSSNLLTPASAGFFGGNSPNSRSSTSLSSDIDEEEHNAVPRDSLLLVAQEPEKREEEEDGADSAQDDQSGVVGGVGYEPLADETSEKEEEEDNRLSDNEGPFDEDPTQSGQSEDGDVPSREAPDGRDPLGDVFPSDGDTWSGIHTEMTDNTAVSPTSDSRMHPDRADYLGRTSEDSDFTEELPLADSNADDFQEVLDLLNAKQQQPDLAVHSPTEDTSLATDILPGELPSQVPESVLRSPIILDEHKPDSSEPEFLASPESTTSMESIRGRRPAPLILGPSDKIPSILEGLQPTPPGRHSLTLDTAFADDPSTPQPERNSTISSDGGDYDDEYTQEKEMKKQLDELERSISSLSPRELSPLPLVTERSPAGRSRNGTPINSLNGVNGPRFRSEALGVELAHKLAAGYAPSNGSRDASPHWPAIPFEKTAPIFTSSPNSNTSIRTESNSAASAMSEETRVRSHLQAEEDQLAASRKYRPPTPANKDGPPAESTPPLGVLTTMPPIPIAPRISSVSSPKNSSRFSADSAVSEENGRGTSVVGRSLRKLWRKSGAAAQASARLSAGAKQSAARNAGKEDALPPLPQTNSSVQPAALRQELRAERPDSGQDPFFFDQQSPYPTFRAASPSMYQQPQYRDPQAARAQAPAPAPTANKTRSILKGRRASPPAQETPQAEVREKSKGFFPSRRPNTNDQASPPRGQSDQHVGLNVSRSDSRDGDASGNKSRKSPPAGLVTPDNSLQTGGQNLSPSAFPRTASRSSFDAEETAYRPSMDSGDPLTPRLSQFEIVSPRGKSFELEEDRRAQVNGSR